MATAYAAFTSLMHLIRDLHEHPRPPIQLDLEQVDSLNSNISFFQRFLEDHHNTIDLGFEIRIADAARAAEDLIETHITYQIPDIYGRLQSVIEGLDLFKKEATETNQNKQSQGNNQPRRHVVPLVSSQSASETSREKIVVGIEDVAMKIVDKLTPQYKSDRQIISISGMGGIGKTTLARHVYDKTIIKNYFDICAWTTISKDYNTQQCLAELLHCLGRKESKESLSEENEYNLGQQLYQNLIGRRYLVILDDVWDIEAWDRLRSFFPGSSGSKIVITTRELPVAAMISSHRFDMELLDESRSWDLFCKKVFGQNSCPRELEDVGKNIANACRGLPLSIVVIGGHLANSPTTQTYWKYIADNLSSVVNSENDEHCLKILSLSYTHLPVHLKSCFLYMGIFPEDKEIWVSEIIRIWMVEDILKPISGKCLEEAAKEYLNDLIARNLILASELSRRGKVKSCRMHDLLRDLCLKKELEKNFFRIVQKQGLHIRAASNKLKISFSSFYETTRVRTLRLSGQSPSWLLRWLILGGGNLTIDDNQIIEHSDLVNLHCLTVRGNYRSLDLIFPQSICFLWNLQSLAVEHMLDVEVPPEIWKMPQLRHIDMPLFDLPIPPSESNDILKNLQSASRILNFTFSEDLVNRVPNIKKLAVEYNDEVEEFNEMTYTLNNIARLEKLESFYCSLVNVRSITRNDIQTSLTFPHSIKKVIFKELYLDNVIMTNIGSLPLLEVLVLSRCSGRELKLVEGQFVRLKHLALYSCDDLQYFTADVNHFPCLEQLVLRSMPCLKEISSDIGEIPTLRSIELWYSLDSAVVSVKEIADEQCENGNEEFQTMVLLDSLNGLSPESLSASNFHVRCFYY